MIYDWSFGATDSGYILYRDGKKYRKFGETLPRLVVMTGVDITVRDAGDRGARVSGLRDTLGMKSYES